MASQILDSRLDQSWPMNTSRRLLNQGGTTRVHHAHILLPEGNRGSPPELQVVMNPWQQTHSTTQACLERKGGRRRRHSEVWFANGHSRVDEFGVDSILNEIIPSEEIAKPVYLGTWEIGLHDAGC